MTKNRPAAGRKAVPLQNDPLQAGLAAHRRGDLAGALTQYEKALRRAPDNPDVLHLSGLALAATGDVDAGLKRLRSAAARKPGEPSFRASLVQSAAQAGRWEEAAAAAVAFARELPAAPAASHCLLALANLLFDAGRPADALSLYRQARALVPDGLEAAHNAACCLRDLAGGDPDRREAARRAFVVALSIDPAAAETWTQLAALGAVRPPPFLPSSGLPPFGRPASGAGPADALRRALLIGPPRADLTAALAAARLRGGDAAAAWGACRAGAALFPADAAGWINAAAILTAAARGGAAVSAASRAVRLAPADAQAHLNLGLALQGGLKRSGVARDAYRRAVALSPADPAGWRNLGAAALASSSFDAATAALDRALIVAAAADEIAAVHSNRGMAFMSSGRQAAATAAFRTALELAPGDLTTRSNLLFCLCFDAETSPETVYADHRAYERFAPPFPPSRGAGGASVPAAPRDGRLRIGYVSPDFQRYPGPGFHFLLPLLARCDRSRYAVICYYDDATQDAATDRFRACADVWRDVAGWSDARLAAQVAADGVDVLVDAGGHMSRNRMAAFAGRMAPVQISFPLYPNTTGLTAMDYQFGDAHLTPPFMQDFRSEALIRLPGTVLCYRPAESPVAPPPRSPWETTGRFTFASFNNLAKIDDATVDVWARALTAAPDARLALKWRGLADGAAARLTARFVERGVGPERLSLLLPTPDPYEAYASVDLCLDPLFAAGGTTTCDALWMGAPVLTLPGRTAIGRWGASLLSAVGLGDDFIASSAEDYIARAVAFARNPASLSVLRQGLRERVQASPLMDEQAYARVVERAYDEVHRRFRAGAAPTPFDAAALS